MSYVNDTHTESSKIVHINSIDATSTFSSDRTTDFIYELEQPINCPENQVLLVSCIGATIPYTFYNIRSQINNRLCVRLTESGTIYNIDIQAGNYSSTSLLLKIKEIFDGLAITETINITYDRNTMKFLFSIVGGSGTCWFDFTTETNPYPLNVELGFSLCATSGTAKYLMSKGIECKKINKVSQGSPHIVEKLNIILVTHQMDTFKHYT